MTIFPNYSLQAVHAQTYYIIECQYPQYGQQKGNNMKEGQFCSVHFSDGCCIGKIVSDDGDTITVAFYNGIMKGIPKERVIPFGY